MTDLPALRDLLVSRGSPLSLAADDGTLPAELRSLLATVPGNRLTVSPGADGIQLDGQTLTVTGASAGSWPVQGMAGLVVSLASATVTVVNAAGVSTVSATAAGAMPVAGRATAVTLAPATVQQTPGWTLTLAGPTAGLSASGLLAIAGASAPAVPPGLDVLDAAVTVAPAGFVITFFPGTTYHPWFNATLSVPGASWTVIDGVLDLTGLDVALFLTPTVYQIVLIGHVTVSGVALDLRVGLGSGSQWMIEVVPGQGDAFPGVAALADWLAGGTAPGGQVTSAFQSVGFDLGGFDLAISAVRVAFDWNRRALSSVQIVSLLTIRALQLDVGLQLPGLTVTGQLHGGKPVSLGTVLSSFGLDIPGMPVGMTLSAAAFSARPGAGLYSVNLQLDDAWPVGPLALTEVLVQVARDPAVGFTGAVSGTLLIGGSIFLTLVTEYDGSSWTFLGTAGDGDGLQLGDLLTELASAFGINAVPAPMRSLELTGLSLSYQTGTGEFAFRCAAGFTVETTPVAVVVMITVTPSTQAPAQNADPHTAVTQGTRGYSATFTGQVTLAGQQFDIVFDLDDTGADVLVADYVHTGDPVALQALVADVAPDLAQAIPPGISIDLEEVKFVFLKQTSSQWAFGLRLGAQISLSELPIVGSKLPPEATLAVQNLQILYSNADLAADQTAIINPLLPAGVAKLPDTVAQGIAFDADLVLGTTAEHVHAGVTPPAPASAVPASAVPAIAPAPAAAAAAAAAPVPASSTDPVKWFDVNKQFGIFSFQRVGVGYQDNVLEFALDASVALGPLAFSMQALTVGSPLTKFEPEFSLEGLALTFDQPPLAIGGALLRVQESAGGKTFDSYYGELIVQAATFSLKALGGWAPDADPALFFIYLSIDTPLGGPPFLFVTGLAGGFGINSSLVLPTIDQVAGYPLLPGVAPAEQATPAQTIAAVIPALQQTFQPRAGDYWVAAGVAFTSFEMIQAQAVVSVLFGVDLQIGVVGTCAMTFPTGDPYPVAYVEIDVVASFTPSTGLLAVDGKLSPASYLFGGFVQLTGGFAFYAWFSGVHQGDFVVSLGGYHPAFIRPDNYPVVPRLALAFSLGPLKVLGQAYFALTPGMFMAGVRLTATFEAGPIKAWFDAGVDFLIAWAPFHYEAHAWVTIGCSVDLGLFTISVQIGADLQIWGPAFGGQALVDLDVVSFTIGFGADRSAPAPVGWDTFAAKFLPPPQAGAQPAPMLARIAAAVAAEAAPPPVPVPVPVPVPNILKATVTAGLLSTSSDVDWILDPDQFRILTASTIPANHALWATSAGQTAELANVVAGYQRAAAPPDAAVPPDASAAQDAAAAAPTEMLLQLGYDTVTYSGSQVWAPALNIGPMDQANVASYLIITLRKRDEDGNLADYVTGVTVTPQLTASSTALWGAGSPAPDPNADRLIPATLTGFAISPVPRNPDQVSDVPLEALIYGEGNSTGFGYQAPATDQQYAVSSTTSPDGQTFTIDITGSHTAALVNQGYVLSALTDPWVTSQRTATLDQLRQLGFTTLPGSDVTLANMAQTALTNWPSGIRIGTETWA